MKFGTIHLGFWDEGMTEVEVLDRWVNRMLLAERLGYWSSWTTEHHFANDPDYRPFGWDEARFHAYDIISDPLTMLMYVAAKTTKLRLGTAVLVPHYDNPVRAAERVALLDIMSRGRVELGVGRGSGFKEPHVFNCPADQKDNQDKFFEELDIMLACWTGKPFSYDGKYFQIPEITVVPSPHQKPHPQVFLSNGNERSIRYAAEHGLSYAGTTGNWGWVDVDRHNEYHRIFCEVSAEHGHDGTKVLTPDSLFLYCAPTDSEAEEVAEHHCMLYTAHVEAHYERQRNGVVTMPALALAGGPGPNAQLEDIRNLARLQVETNLVGSPDTCAQKLEALLERVPSINYITLVTDAGSPPDDFVERSMRLFAEEVIPKFANREPAAAGVDG